MKERWPEMLEYQQKVQSMTDLERGDLLMTETLDAARFRRK